MKLVISISELHVRLLLRLWAFFLSFPVQVQKPHSRWGILEQIGEMSDISFFQ